ncbi:MAG: CpsD/CapB family tyrosine-protein kinase [Deltaproteobacteria bacterium]|nr:CpsD/CapB family tyrosine-protein kinase [Deltaproteobacteria bacterium]
MSTKEEALKKAMEQMEGLKGRVESLQKAVEKAVRKTLEGDLPPEEAGGTSLSWETPEEPFREGKVPVETLFPKESRYSLEWYSGIHSLAINIKRKVGEGKKGAVLFTSSVPGEGTTTLCSNVSLALARVLAGNVLLLDCNARHPEIHKLFNTESIPGLTDILMEKINWEEAIRKTTLKNYYVLPFGQSLQDPWSLLGSVAMEGLLNVLKVDFDFIFLDAPPILEWTGAEMIVPWVEAAVLIIKAHSTRREVVMRAAERIIDRREFIGAILNQQKWFTTRFLNKGHR